MSNYQKVSVSNEARTELHDLINLTGAEVSINKMPASAQVPLCIATSRTRKSMVSWTALAILPLTEKSWN